MAGRTLYGPDGKPLPAAQRMKAQADAGAAVMRRAFEGAGTSHASLAKWNPSGLSESAAIRMDRASLSRRVRDLVRNDGPTGTAVEKKLNSVVGAHWNLSAKPNAKRLGLNDAQADMVEEQIEAEWQDYAYESGFWGDVERDGDADDLLNLAARHLIVDGEAFGVLGWREAPTGYSTCLQIIHPARCENERGLPDTETMRDGCEVDENNATVAYYFRRGHPGDMGMHASRNSLRWDRYERETAWGRPRVLHVRMKQEAGMKRAVSDFASVLRERRQGHQLTDYELQASMLNAISALFIETPLDMFDAMDSIAPESDGAVLDKASQSAALRNDMPLQFDGVDVKVGVPGEKLTLTKPNHPNANFEPFMRGVLRSLAARVGITYEQLTGDWSEVNYSSARAAILEMAKGFVVAAALLKKQFMGPWYRAWLEEAFDQGRIDLPAGVPSFDEMPEAWSSCDWIGTGKGYIDPEKEVKASLLRIAGGLSTKEKEIGEQGGDYKQVARQRARERQLDVDSGLDPDSAKTALSDKPKEPEQEEKEDQSPASARRRSSGVPLVRKAAA